LTLIQLKYSGLPFSGKNVSAHNAGRGQVRQKQARRRSDSTDLSSGSLRAHRRAKHDYRSFYETEIGFRKQLCYPPFCFLVNIMARSRIEEKALTSINEIFKELTEFKNITCSGIEILGPTPASRPKLHNLFRWQILLKGGRDELLSAAAKRG